MKILITTDAGTLLDTVDGKDCGCSDEEILKRGGMEGGIRTHYDLPALAEDQIDLEIQAMIARRRAGP